MITKKELEGWLQDSRVAREMALSLAKLTDFRFSPEKCEKISAQLLARITEVLCEDEERTNDHRSCPQA